MPLAPFDPYKASMLTVLQQILHAGARATIFYAKVDNR